MKIEYTLTFEEYRESLKVHSAGQTRHNRISKWRSFLIIIFIILLVSSIDWLFDLGPQPIIANSNPIATQVALRLIFIPPAIPLLFILLVIVLAGSSTKRNRTSKSSEKPLDEKEIRLYIPRSDKKRFWFLTISKYLIFVGCVVFVAVMLRQNLRDFGQNSSSQDSPHFFSPILLAGYPILMAWLSFYLPVKRFRAGSRTHWDSNPTLAEPHVLEVRSDGIAICAASADHIHRWPAFPKFVEGNRLFLIYVTATSFHIVPKRAFPTPDDEEHFLVALTNGIGNGLMIQRNRGFQVNPAIKPVLPIEASAQPVAPPEN